MDTRNRFEEWMPTSGIPRTISVVRAGAGERTGSSIGDEEQDERSPIEGWATLDGLGANGRDEKVALVRASLEAGIYSISAQAVASRMVDAILSPRPKR